MRLMFDAVTVSAIPKQATLVAGYADGDYRTLDALHKRFPHAQTVTITVNGSTHGVHVIDCETGDANPQQAAEWCAVEVRAGRTPTVYMNASTWPAVKAAVKRAGVTGKVNYWVADWTGHPHLPKGAVACQYANPVTSGGDYDLSVVAAHWPGVDPAGQKPVPLIPATRQAAETLAANLSNRHAPVPAGKGDRAALAAAIHEATRVLAL